MRRLLTLGLSRVKIEFEDLAFKYLDRVSIMRLQKSHCRKKEREGYVNKFISP